MCVCVWYFPSIVELFKFFPRTIWRICNTVQCTSPHWVCHAIRDLFRSFITILLIICKCRVNYKKKKKRYSVLDICRALLKISMKEHSILECYFNYRASVSFISKNLEKCSVTLLMLLLGCAKFYPSDLEFLNLSNLLTPYFICKAVCHGNTFHSTRLRNSWL